MRGEILHNVLSNTGCVCRHMHVHTCVLLPREVQSPKKHHWIQGWRIWDGRIFSRLNYSIMLSKLLHHPITSPRCWGPEESQRHILAASPCHTGTLLNPEPTQHQRKERGRNIKAQPCVMLAIPALTELLRCCSTSTKSETHPRMSCFLHQHSPLLDSSYGKLLQSAPPKRKPGAFWSSEGTTRCLQPHSLIGDSHVPTGTWDCPRGLTLDQEDALVKKEEKEESSFAT